MFKKTRHPEKILKDDNISPKKPYWIKKRFKAGNNLLETQKILDANKVNTVCREANCPNLSECWSKKHATVMIMGDTCTRACSFCNVITGQPGKLDNLEPFRVARTVYDLSLSHVVITSVNRDDLLDCGVNHFVKTVEAIRELNPNTTVEILTPDFKSYKNAAKEISGSNPDVFNHNLETVPRLYNSVRPGARYFSSLKLLNEVKVENENIFTKSGLMVGLGETKEELIQVMDDLRSANVDFLTIGQYLQPTKKHSKIEKFFTPEEFEQFKNIGYSKGFLLVSSSPFTRSSYHADTDFQRLKKIRFS